MKLIARSLFALSLLVLTSFASHAQKVEDIIQKHMAAIGGEDVWKKVNTLHMEGGMKVNSMDIIVTINSVHMKATRQDITMMGMAGYTIITDKEGWMFMPFGGQTAPEAMTPDQVKQGKYKLDLQGDFVDYKTKGTKVDFIGKDEVEGTEVFKLKVIHKDSTEKTVFIDANNYYLIREVDKFIADGKESEVAIDYSNFQKQPSGIVFAMTMGVPQGEVSFTKVEVNAKVDESLFKAPTK
jgi:hypothetical protein